MGIFVAVAVEVEILKTLVLLLKMLRPSNSRRQESGCSLQTMLKEYAQYVSTRYMGDHIKGGT